MRFLKVHGAGNDFVLLPDLAEALDLSAALVRALCRPRLGLGADGVLRVAPPRPGTHADAFMDYRNADGSVAEMCGNGVRCVAKYLVDHGLAQGPQLRIDTRDGVKSVTCVIGAEGRVATADVALGEPVPLKVDLALEVPALGTVHVTTLSLGNPHAVVVVEDVAMADVATLGPTLERHEEFPDRTNVEFIAVKSRGRLAGRIWERGVGETMASGTGAAAMAAAAHLLGLTDRGVAVELPGGELEARWEEDGMWVAGPAVEVATGELDAAWLAAAVTA